MAIDIQYLTVFVAGVVSMIAGMVWYVPFAKLLTKIRALTPAEQKQAQQQMGLMFGIGFVLNLLMAFVLFFVTVVADMFYHWGAFAGIYSAIWMYLGFVVPVQAAHIIFGNYGEMSKKMKLFAINTGGQLVTMLTMGTVIGFMR
jgi:hypothetical protein